MVLAAAQKNLWVLDAVKEQLHDESWMVHQHYPQAHNGKHHCQHWGELKLLLRVSGTSMQFGYELSTAKKVKEKNIEKLVLITYKRSGVQYCYAWKFEINMLK